MVIFGCGYVGRALARAAIGSGWEVWIHSRNADSLAAVEEVPAARRITGNLHEAGWHERLGGDWDVVFNLVSSAGGGLDGYRLSYLEGNRSIRKWAENVSVGRFIYTSATSVYPQTDGQWVGEADVPEDLKSLSPSGGLLRQSELEILESPVFPERAIARLAGIYGPGRHLYLSRLRDGADSIPGDGSGWLNLIYLPDIVSALMRLAESSWPKPADVFNVVDDAPARKQDIVDWLAARLGVQSVPFDPAQSGARASRRQVQGGLPNRRVRNGKFRQTFGWRPEFKDYKAGYADILKTA